MDLGTIFTMAAYGVGALTSLTAFISSFYTIPEAHVGLVTRFGRHVRTNDKPGPKLKIPLIESVQGVSMQEQIMPDVLDTKTKKGDDVTVKLPISIHYNIVDPATYTFKKTNPLGLMKDVVSAAVREYTSTKTFQEIYDERMEIKDYVLEKIKEQVAGYGILVNDIIINEPQVSSEMKANFDRVRSSALALEAAQNEAQAEYIKTVKDAEAHKMRDLQRGEGAAGYRKKIFDQYAEQIDELVQKGTPREEAVHVMMKIMELDTWREVGDKGNAFVITGSGGDGGDFAKRLKETIPVNEVLNSKKVAVEQNNSTVAAPAVAMPS